MAVLVEGRSVPVPGPLAADGVRRWAVTSVVEAFVPLPDGASVLCVQLTTAQPQDWELYTDVFAELLKSVQFGWDGVPAAPAAPLPAVPPAATVLLVPVAEPTPAAPPLPAAPPTAPPAAEDGAAELPVHLRGTPVRVPRPTSTPSPRSPTRPRLSRS